MPSGVGADEFVGVLADDRRDSRAWSLAAMHEHREQGAARRRPLPRAMNRIAEQMCLVRTVEAPRPASITEGENGRSRGWNRPVSWVGDTGIEPVTSSVLTSGRKVNKGHSGRSEC